MRNEHAEGTRNEAGGYMEWAQRVCGMDAKAPEGTRNDRGGYAKWMGRYPEWMRRVYAEWTRRVCGMSRDGTGKEAAQGRAGYAE